jgi:nicotinamidase/pyrazinamidase
MKQALIMVDVQNDFMPGGALPTRNGDEVVPVFNRLQPLFDFVVATQDWHPANHGSFASNHPGRRAGEVIDLDGLQQILWPDHCVQGTRGAEFHRHLERSQIDRVIQKGTDPAIDSYSAFFDNGRRRSTGLEDGLRDNAVTNLYVGGLATDYCVLWSVRDAINLGFRTRVIRDACRGVELQPGDMERAFTEMESLGAEIVTSAETVRNLAAGS